MYIKDYIYKKKVHTYTYAYIYIRVYMHEGTWDHLKQKYFVVLVVFNGFINQSFPSQQLCYTYTTNVQHI